MSQSGTGLPNFVLVGAAKAGTTSLYHYLRQHPEVYLPDSHKESRFFASELLKDVLHYKQTSVFTFEDFKALYRGAEAYKAIGDFGNAYLSLWCSGILLSGLFPLISLPAGTSTNLPLLNKP
jgi:hypothetical protein